jgi:hypothetical protein
MDMTNLSAELKVPSARQIVSPALSISNAVLFALVAGAAFGLYLFSALSLQVRNETMHFGADAHLYASLAHGTVFDRVVRFHPVTIALAAAWMAVVKPLAVWVAPQILLKAMFAAIGALGVWAAMSAFAVVMPRRQAAIWGGVYATSLGVWYFSSIEESKIVTATLCALYIALYLHLREQWTTRGALLLTAVLLIACLNEIVSGFLVVIPLVDTLIRQGWDFRRTWWIGVHALAGPLALVILEGAINGWLIPEGRDAEGASHFSMLFFYLAKNEFSVSSLYAFGLNWLFFNIAAPAPDARLWVPGLLYHGSYFEPALASYLSSPACAALAGMLGVLAVASVLPRYRARIAANATSILFALLAYSLLRGAFFFVFNPREPLLFTPAVTLAHMLMLGIPFAASRIPAKSVLLTALAALLLIANGAFIIGR